MVIKQDDRRLRNFRSPWGWSAALAPVSLPSAPSPLLLPTHDQVERTKDSPSKGPRPASLRWILWRSTAPGATHAGSGPVDVGRLSAGGCSCAWLSSCFSGVCFRPLFRPRRCSPPIFPPITLEVAPDRELQLDLGVLFFVMLPAPSFWRRRSRDFPLRSGVRNLRSVLANQFQLLTRSDRCRLFAQRDLTSPLSWCH